MLSKTKVWALRGGWTEVVHLRPVFPDLCTRAAARAMMLDASLPSEPSGPCGRPRSCAVRARRAVHSAALLLSATPAALATAAAFRRDSERLPLPDEATSRCAETVL
jgi:hypothetical protein